MDRTVPQTGSEEIELYMRTYYSLLRSTGIIQIETLAESHMAMESSLHVKARDVSPDVSALVYSALRLPAVMPFVDQILVGQLEKSFLEAGYSNVESWRRVDAPARRRRIHFDGEGTLAVFIASRSDIDDMVPTLTAYQIEWNKLHDLLQSEVSRLLLAQNQPDSEHLADSTREVLASTLKISIEDLERLEYIWKDDFVGTLHRIADSKKQLGMNLLTASVTHYRKATAYWWENIQRETMKHNVDPTTRPVYFVSSNTHSMANLLTGFAGRIQDDLIAFIHNSGDEQLVSDYNAMLHDEHTSHRHNFFYYVLKKYISHEGQSVVDQCIKDEIEAGIYRMQSHSGFQIDAEVVEIAKLKPEWIDPRLCDDLDKSVLGESDALILNIDYPLGLAAYEILSRITERIGHLQGAYIMGKAATLNGRIGDVMIPNVIHDEHSSNTYLFNNCFSAGDITSYMSFGMVLDNQKAISTRGTFLQNPTYMSVFYHEGYTDIEMEGGPYLSSLYEAYRPKRYPQNEVVNLHSVPFDIGFLHYASDTPMSKGHNLGTANLGYAGVDPTYASAIAILRRILHVEAGRIRAKHGKNGKIQSSERVEMASD